MKYARFAFVLLAIIASGYGIHKTYAFFTRPPTAQEIQEGIDEANKKIIAYCNNHAVLDATGSTARLRELDSNRLKSLCLQDLREDFKIHEVDTSATGSVIPEPPKSSNVQTGVSENDSQPVKNPRRPLSMETIEILKENQNLSILDVLNLDWCRIVQKEDSHILQKRGHFYATDIACERGKSFTVSAPQWKKQYKVVGVGVDKRIGHYIVLEHQNYRFVFGHTFSPQKIGDIIPAGSQIGYTDASGIAENVHLHFELWRDGYNITADEMLGKGSRWNDEYSFKLLAQRGWYTGIDDAIDFITPFEGFSGSSYEDPKGSGRWSIGYGTYASGAGETITKAEAKKRIYTKVFENMDFIYRNRLALTRNERIALSSFFYNLGTARPEMVKALKERNFAELEKLWKSYITPGSIYEGGLLKRRIAEWLKFISR